MATNAPLDEQDLMALIRLAFAWNCTAQEALRRALAEAIQRAEGDEAESIGTLRRQAWKNATGHDPGEGA